MLWVSMALVVLLLFIHTGADSEHVMAQSLGLFREDCDPPLASFCLGSC